MKMVTISIVLMPLLAYGADEAKESVDPKQLKGVELYDWLGYEGMMDPELSNDYIHDVLEEGIYKRGF